MKEELSRACLPVNRPIRLAKGLRSLSDLLNPPAGERSYRDWALWLQELLEKLGVCESLAGPEETILKDALDSLLLSLAGSEMLSGPCPTDYAGFLGEWQTLMQMTPLHPQQA